MEHERKEAFAFQQKMEEDRIKFEAQLATTLQQQSSQFQVNLCSRAKSSKQSCLKSFLIV